MNAGIASLLTFIVTLYLEKDETWTAIGFLLGSGVLSLVFGLLIRDKTGRERASGSMKLSVTNFSVSFTFDAKNANENPFEGSTSRIDAMN